MDSETKWNHFLGGCLFVAVSAFIVGLLMVASHHAAYIDDARCYDNNRGDPNAIINNCFPILRDKP